MGYAVLIHTQDGRLWYAGRRICLTPSRECAQFYHHPSSCRVAVNSFERKLSHCGTIRPRDYYIVKWRDAEDYFRGAYALPKPIPMLEAT